MPYPNKPYFVPWNLIPSRVR